jgi:hypothetical protein
VIFVLGGDVTPTNTMTQNVPVVETVNKDDEEVSDPKSETTDDWESQWHDFGELPVTLISEFNVALAEFLVKQIGSQEKFPEIIRKEGGIHSYKRLVTVFNRPCPKIFEILGGRVSRKYEMELVKCIALASFLKLPEFAILGTDDVPEYRDFKQDAWTNFLANNHRTLTNEYRKELNSLYL